MTQSKPTLDMDTALRRKIDRLVDGMGESKKAFFLEQPDALRHVFDGGISGYFEKARIELPPSGLTKYAMEDAAGWQALQDGRVTVSMLTRGVTVDYQPDRSAVFAASGVIDDPDDTEDLEDLMERRRIRRAGGSAYRRLKRLWFDGDASYAELEGVIRLQGWKQVDARTLVAWCALHRHELDPQETIAASAMPLLKRDSRSLRLTSGASRMRDRNGPFFGFKRDDAGVDPIRRIFDRDHSFLVEVPDDRGA